MLVNSGRLCCAGHQQAAALLECVLMRGNAGYGDVSLMRCAALVCVSRSLDVELLWGAACAARC